MTPLSDYKAGKLYDLARAVAAFNVALDAQVEAENAVPDFPVAIEAEDGTVTVITSEDQNLSSFNYARAGLVR